MTVKPISKKYELTILQKLILTVFTISHAQYYKSKITLIFMIRHRNDKGWYNSEKICVNIMKQPINILRNNAFI